MKIKALTTLALLCATAAFADVVKIGVVLPLSGNNAQLGERMRPAVELFEKENASRGYKHTYKVILEDDQLTPRLAAQAANKLLNIDKVDGIITFSSSTGHVVAPMARQKKVPHICIGSDTTIASKNTYNFLHWVKPASEAEGIVQIIKKYGGQNVAILSMRHQGVQAIIDEVKRKLEAHSIALAGSETFNPGERDFRTLLTRLREKNPDILIPLTFSPELEIILRQTKEVGINVPMPAAETYDFTTAAELAEGQYYVSGSTGTEEFKAHLLATTGTESSYALPFVYSALDLYRAAYERNSKTDRDAAAEFLSNLKDYPSAVGLISTDENRYIDTPPAYFKIENGKVRSASLEEIEPISR